MNIKKLIIHCSYTPPSMDIGADTIRDWHKNGNGWSDIGYHYVIRRDGSIEKGRQDSVAGAHARGHNSNSLGICLVGGKKPNKDEPDFNYTAIQLDSLQVLVNDLCVKYGVDEVIGHNEVDSGKTCPNFDVQSWRSLV